MRFRTAALATAAAIALATLPAAAQGFGPPRHGEGHGEGNPILHMAKELGLSETQTTQVKSISSKYMDGALGQAMDATREARMTVMKTVHNVNATDDQVREAAAVVAALDAQIAVQHHQMAIEISKVLSPDQRAKLADMFQNMAGRHGGPGPGGRGGAGGF